MAAFEPAAAFAGIKKGYAFKAGPKGTGYYAIVSPPPDGDSDSEMNITTNTIAAFEPSATFAGVKKGYEFKTGPKGTGYYAFPPPDDAYSSELKMAPQVYISTLHFPQGDGVVVKADHGLVIATLGAKMGGAMVQSATLNSDHLNFRLETLKTNVLKQLKQAAANKGANGVLGFSLSISTAVGNGNGNLVAVAQGTAVTIDPLPKYLVDT